MSTAGEIRYRITGDNSQVNNALNNTANRAEVTAQAVGQIAEAINTMSNNAAQAQAAMNRVAETVVNNTSTVAASSAALTETLQRLNENIERISETSRQTREETERSSSRISNALKKVSSAAGKAVIGIAKIGATATAAAATAIGALSKLAIESYADYEQLVGGVETLFKDSAILVEKYADEAYKSAGLSANAYMETVTSFSASLLQGLENDTEAAAEIANMAVIDMADNANKMGTDMQSIQNAYQGFAKANYTMLDNLKLGYGGTKEEMQRLLSDAEKISGIKFDLSNFADVVKAIHVIQENMGITGTTAKEAATTIQGSISMMKAAWENLMTGVADPTQDFDRLLENLVDSVMTVADNLAPRIMAVLPQMARGVTELANKLLPMIPETLEDMLPAVLEGANALISALLDALSNIAVTAIPIITENAGKIIETLVNGLADAFPQLAGAAADLITEFVTAILSNAETITHGAIDIIIALADGISDNLPELVPAVVEAVLMIAETLIDNIDELLIAAERLITALSDGIINALPKLYEKAPEIITKLIGALINAIPETITFVVEFLTRCADQLVNFDWSEIARTALDNLSKAFDFDNAIKNVQVTFDNIFTGGSIYGGDINNVDTSRWSEVYQNTAEKIVDNINTSEEFVRKAFNDGMKELGRTIAPNNGEDWFAAEEERAKRAQAVLDKYKPVVEAKNAVVSENSTGSGNTGGIFGATTASLESELEKLENLYATHKVTEEQYWADRKAVLEKYRDDNDPEWWKLYDKVTDHYDKLAKTEEAAVKNSISDKFRELETEQLENGYDDSWLLQQERDFLETLDHNSEAYKDYNLKLLKEQQTADNKALKEAQTAADKAKNALEKSYNSIVKSRDSMASSLRSSGDLFSTSEETDKRTGEKKKSRGVDISGFEKKIEAKKKLTSKIADLLEKDTPMELVKQLLKQDPEDALVYANSLLKNPDKLSRIKSDYAEDKSVSNMLANLVTKNSDEFEQLGTDSGNLFGESFMEAFKANWEETLKTVFADENYLNSAALSVSAANSAVGNTVTTPVSGVQTDSSETTSARSKTSLQQDIPKYAFVYLDRQLLGKAVREENKKYNTIGGG